MPKRSLLLRISALALLGAAAALNVDWACSAKRRAIGGRDGCHAVRWFRGGAHRTGRRER
jgi:hypothetical protein